MPRTPKKPAPAASKSRRKSAASGKDPKKVEAGRQGGKASAAARGGERTPGSGRKPGTPNRRTVEVLQVLEANGYNPDAPFLFWAELLSEGLKPKGEQKIYFLGHSGGNLPLELHGPPTLPLLLKAAADLAQYVAPKRRAVDLGLGEEGPPEIVFEEDFSQLGTPRGAAEGSVGTAAASGAEAAPRPRRRIVLRASSGLLDALTAEPH